MDSRGRAQVAEDELPLVEVRAVVSAQRRAKNYSVSWMLFEEEDQKAFDAFLNGPSGRKVVLMSISTLPADWKAAPVDPDQGEDEADHTTQLMDRWESLVELMTADVEVPS